jgi:hypothetical protein
MKEILTFQFSYDLQNTAHQFKQMCTNYKVGILLAQAHNLFRHRLKREE